MRVTFRSSFAICVVFLTVCLVANLTFAQSLGGAGTVQGKVTDPSGAVVPGATVTIKNPVTGFERTTTTDQTGGYLFRNVPQNTYHLSATAKGFNTAQADVDIRSAVPVALDLTLKLASSSTTIDVVAGELVENVPTAHTDIDASQVAKIPLESGVSGLSQVLTLASPGVVADSNGFFHPLGDHAQTSFSIDNQPVSDQQSKVYSNQLSTDAIQSLEVITGVAPAEFGDKTSLVAVATTKSGLGQTKPTGSISASYGTFGSTGMKFNLGVGTARVGNFLSLNGINTSRFLDTPEFLPIHAKGNSETFFDRFDIQPNSKDSFHLNLFAARSWFQAPNTYDQAAAGQDQRQRMLTFDIAPSWTHLFSPQTLLTVNAFARQDRLQYYPSAIQLNDQPATVGQGRRLTNVGFRADLSYVKGHHNFKTGVQVSHTALSENFRFGITDPTSNPVCLDVNNDPVLNPAITDPATCAGLGFTVNPELNPGLVPFDLTRGGALFAFRDKGGINQQAVYAQDIITFGNFTASLGLRVDHYDGLVEQWGAQPRVGVSYHIARTGTVIRGSYGRTMESPYNENLLLSSATGAGGLAANAFGTVVTDPLRPGTRNQYNAGFEQAFGRYMVISADYFWKFTRNAYDFNTLGDTPIAFPISWNKSKLDGYSVHISVPEVRGFRASTVIGHTRARYFNPENGGLFFDTNPPTGVFRIDHDQAFQQTTNLQYSFLKRNGGWAAFTWRYDSGLAAGAVTDYATALEFSADQQAAIGLFCGSTFATLTSPITSCSDPNRGALRVRIPADGTEDDDKNPPRISPRHLFDVGFGLDNIFRGDHRKWTARVSVLNLTNKIALYNFLSTFSGTHFVTPRTVQGEIGFTF